MPEARRQVLRPHTPVAIGERDLLARDRRGECQHRQYAAALASAFERARQHAFRPVDAVIGDA